MILQIHIAYRNKLNFVDILDIETTRFYSVIHRGIAFQSHLIHLIQQLKLIQ